MDTDPPLPAELKPSTEEVILRAAQAVFVEKGVAGARMQEIADRAGINKALLHYYFKSKERLSEVIIGRTLGLLVPRLSGILGSELELFDKLRAVAAEYAGFLREHPALPLFIINEAHRSPHLFRAVLAGHELPRLELFTRQVAAAGAAGRIRPISAQQLLLSLVSLLLFPRLGQPIFQQAMGLSSAEFEAELARHYAGVAELVIQGLRP